MAAFEADDAAAFATFLEQSRNSVWLALSDGEEAAYMRFEERSFGAASIVGSERTVAITGAFTRPEHRGKGAAVALLDAALRDYASRGFTCCSVDFESFNPEAAAFWMKYFEPVCFSMLRVPELSEW
jgi:GNAT superfamily N-acetyltransferase